MMGHTCNPSTLKAEAGGSRRDQAQPWLLSEDKAALGLYETLPVETKQSKLKRIFMS